MVDGVTLNRKSLCSFPLQVKSEGGTKLHVCAPREDDVGSIIVCRLGLREGRQTRAGLQSRWQGILPARVTGGSARRSNTSLTRKANTQPISNDRDVASQKIHVSPNPSQSSPSRANTDDNTRSSPPRAGSDTFFGICMTLVSQATFRLNCEVKHTAGFLLYDSDDESSSEMDDIVFVSSPDV